MRFYRLSVVETEPARYAWASGYGPSENMPFFDEFPERRQESFLEFWQKNPALLGISIDLGGCEWSDFLGCGGGPPSEFFSERVIDDMRYHGIDFLRCTEMPLGKIGSLLLRQITPPKYFALEASPGIKIRSEPVPLEMQVAASKEIPPRWLGPYRTIAELDTWNGHDLLSPAHGNSLTALFCTDKVKDLAERKGWTNAKFLPIDTE